MCVCWNGLEWVRKGYYVWPLVAMVRLPTRVACDWVSTAIILLSGSQLIPSNAYKKVFLTSLATMHYNKRAILTWPVLWRENPQNYWCHNSSSSTDVVASSEDYYRDFSAYKGRVLFHTRTLLNHEQNSIMAKHQIGTIIAILLWKKTLLSLLQLLNRRREPSHINH